MECSGQPGDGQREVCREGGSKAGGNDPHTCVCAIFLLSVIALIVLLVEPVHTLLGKVQIGFLSGDGHGVWICQ